MDFIKDSLKEHGEKPTHDHFGDGFLDDNFEMMLETIVKEIDLATKVLDTLASSEGLAEIGLPEPLKEFPLDKSMLKSKAISILKSSQNMLAVINSHFGRELDDVKVKSAEEMKIPKPDLGKFKHRMKSIEMLDDLLDQVKTEQAVAVAKKSDDGKPN